MSALSGAAVIEFDFTELFEDSLENIAIDGLPDWTPSAFVESTAGTRKDFMPFRTSPRKASSTRMAATLAQVRAPNLPRDGFCMSTKLTVVVVLLPSSSSPPSPDFFFARRCSRRSSIADETVAVRRSIRAERQAAKSCGNGDAKCREGGMRRSRLRRSEAGEEILSSRMRAPRR